MSNPIVTQNGTPTKVLRCVSWCAVSTGKQAAQDKESLPQQREQNRQYIENLHIYHPGFSGQLSHELETVGSRNIIELGDAIAEYPHSYGVLRKLMEHKAIDAIVCRSLDRLGRNQALIATIVELAKSYDVAVIPRNGIKPDLHDPDNAGQLVGAAVGGAMAQSEVNEIRRRYRDGMTGRVKNRRLFQSGVPYGYAYERDPQTGKTISIVLDEGKAATVRRIFDMYLDGHGTPAIADELNVNAVPTPSSTGWQNDNGRAPAAQWSTGSVRAVLKRRQTYAGQLVLWGEQTDSLKTEQEVFDGDHSPIITIEESERVAQSLVNRGTARRTRLFAGSVFCEECGAALWGGQDDYTYKGKTTRFDVMRCPNRHVVVRDDMLIDVLRDSVEALENAAEDEYLDVTDAGERKRLEKRLQAARKRVEGISAQRAAAVDQLVIHQRITDEEFDVLNAKLDKMRAGIEGEIADLHAKLHGIDHDSKRGERIAEVKASARLILDEAFNYPDRVRPWLQDHVRIYVGRGRGKGRCSVEFI